MNIAERWKWLRRALNPRWNIIRKVRSVGVLRFLGRVWIYRRVLWHDCDYDYDPIARFLHIKLARMAEYHDRRRFIGTWETTARECRIGAELSRRILADDYTWRQECNKVPEHDAKMLGKLLGRKLFTWWE